MLMFRGRKLYFLTEKYPHDGDFETLTSSWKDLNGAIGRVAKEVGVKFCINGCS
jgi:hypothetical protein